MLTRRKKYNTRKKRDKMLGGIFSNYQHVFETPSWQSGARQWTTLVKLKGLHIYGSSIPHEDTYQCLATFLFYMHVKNIKRIISLQGCDVIDVDHTPGNCNGHIYPDKKYKDRHYESRIWNSLKEMSLFHSKDAYIEFLNHRIIDMTAGNFSEWCQLYVMSYTNEDQITLIHCLAGFGRTGSILLLIFLKYYYERNPDKKEDISKEWLGYSSGNDMLIEIILLFQADLEVDDNPSVNQELNADIINFDPESIIHELTNIIDRSGQVSLTLANIIIIRMNYIRLCLGFGYNRKYIFLYEKKTDPTDIHIESLFDSPISVKMTTIDTIIKDPSNRFGIIE